ncbi:MAG: hypothetical protein M3Q71_26065 [Chloroflexota bacterium]|nr:hypothetical protein [Chloroflexota bacterium]MDP9474081.1 hypothetical protein [Chloroflexota bacterium]
MTPRQTRTVDQAPTSGNGHRPSEPQIEPRPFRAADVLTGTIDRRRPSVPPGRGRKQISAQLEPAQVRLLGELHARLNAAATRRIEKSDLVGLGIELLAALLDESGAGESGELDPASGRNGAAGANPARAAETPPASGFGDLDDLRAYLRTQVRAYEPQR